MAKKELCFVIMPFDEEFDVVWEAIKNAGKRFQYLNVERSDTQTPSKGKLFQEIKEKIQQAAFIIADFSRDKKSKYWPNPNVTTEAGFALGVGKEPYLISRSPLGLPSDWSQNKVAIYAPKDVETLEYWFERFLERIMTDHNIATDRTIQRRETQSEKLNWLIATVQKLRAKTKETYDDNIWKVNSTTFHPDSCTFSLVHTTNTENELGTLISTVEIRCGVYFCEWRRRESPFTIKIMEYGANKENIQSSENFQIKLPEFLDTITEEKVWDVYEEKLDEILRKYTPDLSTLTPVAKNMDVIEATAKKLRRMKMEGIDFISRRVYWSSKGYEILGLIEADRSPLKLLIEFVRWEESNLTPYWIRFKPFNYKESHEISKWFKDAEYDGSAWFIPICSKINNAEEIFTEYENALHKMIANYKPLAFIKNAITETQKLEQLKQEEQEYQQSDNTESMTPGLKIQGLEGKLSSSDIGSVDLSNID